MHIYSLEQHSEAPQAADRSRAMQAPEKQSLAAAMQKMQDLGQHDFAAQAVRIMDELQATAPGRSAMHPKHLTSLARLPAAHASCMHARPCLQRP